MFSAFFMQCLLFIMFILPAYSFETQDSTSGRILYYHEEYGLPEFGSMLAEFDYDEYISSGATEFERQRLLLDWVYDHVVWDDLTRRNGTPIIYTGSPYKVLGILRTACSYVIVSAPQARGGLG